MYKYQAELDLFQKASEAAEEACQNMIDKNPGQWYPCGFSWVKIRPARGRFVQMIKDKNFGRTDSYEGGISIWNPSKSTTQWMDAKQAGSYAFAAVLKEAGINCSVESRID